MWHFTNFKWGKCWITKQIKANSLYFMFSGQTCVFKEAGSIGRRDRLFPKLHTVLHHRFYDSDNSYLKIFQFKFCFIMQNLGTSSRLWNSLIFFYALSSKVLSHFWLRIEQIQESQWTPAVIQTTGMDVSKDKKWSCSRTDYFLYRELIKPWKVWRKYDQISVLHLLHAIHWTVMSH